MFKRFVMFGALAALMMSANFAKADVVENWNYSVSAVFTEWKKDGDTMWMTPSNQANSSGYTVLSTANNTKLEWGTRSILPGFTWSLFETPSSLTLKPVNSGTIASTENDAEVKNLKKALTITHENNPITAGTSPSFINMAISIALTPAGVSDAVPTMVELGVRLAFYETPNVNQTENDIFWVLYGLDTVSEPFTYDGETYDISIGSSFLSNDNLITDTYADMIRKKTGIEGEVYGWTTKEGQSTSFDVLFQVRHPGDGVPEIDPGDPGDGGFGTTTPEPATLLMLGLGLAGLPIARRFRKKS